MNTSTLVVVALLFLFCGYHHWSGFQSIVSVWREWGYPADHTDKVLRSLTLPSVIGGTLWDWACLVGGSLFSCILHPCHMCGLCHLHLMDTVAQVRPICSQYVLYLLGAVNFQGQFLLPSHLAYYSDIFSSQCSFPHSHSPRAAQQAMNQQTTTKLWDISLFYQLPHK